MYSLIDIEEFVDAVDVDVLLIGEDDVLCSSVLMDGSDFSSALLL